MGLCTSHKVKANVTDKGARNEGTISAWRGIFWASMPLWPERHRELGLVVALAMRTNDALGPEDVFQMLAGLGGKKSVFIKTPSSSIKSNQGQSSAVKGSHERIFPAKNPKNPLETLIFHPKTGPENLRNMSNICAFRRAKFHVPPRQSVLDYRRLF